jgi:hypothetical protein
MVAVGLVAALVALALTAATLMSYDRLMMPSDFWISASSDDEAANTQAEARPWSVLRPPSQAQVVLFYEMVNVWNVFFVRALSFAFAAVASVIVALAHDTVYRVLPPNHRDGFAFPLLIALIILAAAALILPLRLWYRPKRPELGFND